MPASELNALLIVTVAVGLIWFVTFAFAGVVSLRERELRAGLLAFLLALIVPLPYLLAGLVAAPFRSAFAIALLAITGGLALVLAVPLGRRRPSLADTPATRVDERDIMFSRRLLQVGTPRFEDYYRANPDKKAPDDAFRAKPGLLAPGATAYDPYTFSAADASFATVECLRPLVEGAPGREPLVIDPAAMTRFVKQWTKKLGAISVGVTRLEDYHLYSTVGRGEHYGAAVEREHEFAIALTVEMDKRMVDRAPFGPTVMESAQQYLSSGAIAVQIAQFIRNLGYPARAHIDGNYRVVCPLVARDAGLGEIGRMGLLMTPELGPRVRIAVVTTDVPLMTDRRRPDATTIDFCTRCRKCADACPSDAIPPDDQRLIDGVQRWQIDAEACFTFWCHVGTDCARCVRVCPYSHPDNLLHRLVRRGVKHSALFRRLAITLDDVFYGKQPPPREPPEWMKSVSNAHS